MIAILTTCAEMTYDANLYTWVQCVMLAHTYVHLWVGCMHRRRKHHCLYKVDWDQQYLHTSLWVDTSFGVYNFCGGWMNLYICFLFEVDKNIKSWLVIGSCKHVNHGEKPLPTCELEVYYNMEGQCFLFVTGRHLWSPKQAPPPCSSEWHTKLKYY